MGYTKNIAVIRGLKSGFSADGGSLSGLVKAEKYGASLKVEVSLINFAPLTEGRYVAAISDGKKVCILDGLSFDGVSEVDTSAGFAALICFVNGTVSPVASAICGAFQSAAMGIREEIEKLERVKNDGYNDEALAQENYYEYEQTDKDRGAVRENTEKEKDGESVRKNEKDNVVREKEPTAGGLAGGDFFGRMKDEIEKVLSSYPSERALEETVEDSRWVRINYGGDKFYVFGVIYGGGKPRYICYGVPSTDSRRPPESLSNLASYIPSSPENAEGGYWVMYQDAATGASVKIHGA
ncbi:MAG: hypothetical protein HFK06_06070 [Clostridia bacterium]|nr:hypothetical protein [Clostridia bacterium]